MMTAIQLPIAAAWMYMADDPHYDNVPAEWSQIDFGKVDVLYVGPAGVQSNDTFGLYSSPATGDLATRFRWILQNARAQNPGIKIIVSQWWGTGDGVWGDALDSLGSDAAISAYADSVAAFVQSYLDVSGGVDGYDIDYEDNNVVSGIPALVSQVRARLDALGSANGGRPFYVTVSPAETAYLAQAAPSLNFVNIQTYAGGSGLTPQDFTQMGMQPRQLLYGICPETNCPSPSLAEVESQYTQNNLAGIHLWRLNSDNYAEENQVQAQVYSFLHSR